MRQGSSSWSSYGSRRTPGWHGPAPLVAESGRSQATLWLPAVRISAALALGVVFALACALDKGLCAVVGALSDGYAAAAQRPRLRTRTTNKKNTQANAALYMLDIKA